MDIGSMTIGQAAGWAGAGLVALSTIVQISPIKINPWSWLAGVIGRALNKNIMDEVSTLKEQFTAMQEANDERHAKSARARILRFGDELYDNVYHSQEHFVNIFQDIREYEEYCDTHPRFENDRMHATVQLIRDTYAECLREHKFK